MPAITHRWSASTTAEPPGASAGNPGAFPVAWTEGTASTGIEAFTIYTGVVVSGEFQPEDESFNFTDSCGGHPAERRSRRCAGRR